MLIGWNVKWVGSYDVACIFLTCEKVVMLRDKFIQCPHSRDLQQQQQQHDFLHVKNVTNA